MQSDAAGVSVSVSAPSSFAEREQHQHEGRRVLSEAEQVSLIEKLGIFKIQGRDKRGRRILRIVGKFFPVRFVSLEAVKKFLEEKIFPKVNKSPFSILYIHTGVQRTDNFPGFSALRSLYDAVPVAARDNIEAVYFLHPGSLHSRLFLATFGRLLLFPAGFYGKVKYVSRVDYLWGENVMKRGEVELPEFVFDHDEELDHRPMMSVDYGLESDHPRVFYGPTSIGSTVPIYSLRCIS